MPYTNAVFTIEAIASYFMATPTARSGMASPARCTPLTRHSACWHSTTPPTSAVTCATTRIRTPSSFTSSVWITRNRRPPISR